MGGAKFRDEFSLDFDGSNDYVHCGQEAAVDDIFDGGGSVVAWIKARSDGGGDIGRVIQKCGGTGPDPGWYICAHSESSGAIKIQFDTSFSTTNGLWRLDSTDVTLNQWTHLVVTWNDDAHANQPVIYVNGVSKALTEVTDPAGTYDSDATQNMRIGGNGSVNSWDGRISDVAMYDEILTASQVKILYNDRNAYNHNEGALKGNLKAWYRMGDGTFDTKINDHTDTGIITDETNATLSTDVLGGKGDFSDASYWAITTDESIVEGGVGKWLAQGSYGQMRRDSILTDKKVYRIALETTVNAGTTVKVNLGDPYPTVIDDSLVGQQITFYRTNTANFILWAGDYGDLVTIDNLVLQEVGGSPGIMINMDANDFVGDTP